jgi:cupin fold WbuC family metalloprotein
MRSISYGQAGGSDDTVKRRPVRDGDAEGGGRRLPHRPRLSGPSTEGASAAAPDNSNPPAAEGNGVSGAAALGHGAERARRVSLARLEQGVAPVTAALKTVTAAMIDELVARAASSPRRRTNLNLHEAPSDPINRFLNVGVAGTYVRPHRHAVGRWEMFVVLRGRLDIVTFTADGAVVDRLVLTPAARPVVEIPGGRWHAIVSTAPASVALEVKPGPYDPATDKNFADWAPSEGDDLADECLRWLETAAVGDRWRPSSRYPRINER